MKQMMSLFWYERKGEAQGHNMFSWIKKPAHWNTGVILGKPQHFLCITSIQCYCKMQFLEGGS